MLNATWLETFTTLCQTGHFTKTADQLGMTQPGVSQHLRKLESQIGKPLISKEGKSFSLTPAGETVFNLGKARRDQEKEMREQVAHDAPNSGTVSIGCSGSFAMWLYPTLLDHMHTAPDLVIRLSAAPQPSILSAVLKGELDIAILSENPQNPRLKTTPLAKEELCLVVPATCPIQDISLQTLNALSFVAHPDGYAYADEMLSLNFPNEYQGADRLNQRTFINQISQILLPVAKGLGYTILPRSGIDAFSDQSRLQIVPLAKRRHHDLWLISQHARSEFARISAIRSLIKTTTSALS